MNAHATFSSPYELLSKLVSLPSVNPTYGGSGERQVEEFLRQRLSAKGVAIETQEIAPDRENVVARLGDGDRGALLIEAHMDTVSVEGWAKGDPFELKRENGRYYGRGACDTKSSLASFLTVFEYFLERPGSLRRPLVFAATCDEEDAQSGAYALAKELTRLGVEQAITGEPTRSDLVTRHKGVGRYRIHCEGRAAHGATPELGDNAIYNSLEIVSRLKELGSMLESMPYGSEIERGTLNLGVIRGGSGFNIVPDRCSLDFDRRIGIHETIESARAQLQQIVEEHDHAKLEICLERPPLRGIISRELVAQLKAASHGLGRRAQEREVAYMTNAVAYEAQNVPALVFGPGDIAQAHKRDEYIEEGEMERSIECLKRFLEAG